ncbi:MAG: DUF1573 domain-containing protein [Bacteroidales bacterium]|nr:DUF1573 domain-containing protein [Bacteroidales bacterium]
MNLLFSILFSLLLAASEVLSFDNISHDFGSQPKTVESLEHEFTFTNVSGRSVSISYAVATCSCTRLSWTTGPIQPGAKGSVKAVYIRELGVNSFEKFISVFVDGQTKPYVLRIAGSFYETDKSLADDFPATRSIIGFASLPVQAGEAYSGELANDSFWVANLSDKSISLSFKPLSESLKVVPEYQYIDPNSRTRFYYEISVDTLSLGRRVYEAVPLVDDKPLDPVSFTLTAIENYTGLSRAEVNAGPFPQVLDSECSFGKVRKGQSAQASFQVKNFSRTAPLVIRAVFSDPDGVTADYPASIPPRETGTVSVSIPPAALSKGNNTIKLSIISNSPLMQILQVYINGNVE